ncbi:regulator of chromosome condensation 1/beta-lactamase-inhibitor protein II [Apiosordaria backusii]|uniref:Regulator of chromosome condensation 1/beta-lactamase-inhibitor protein II n=1 Tax=Apiosordaria backusii TaxID=314023 RepID=A0AA40ES13_9PEZI|nr:regulator of chromosome condensation 1/beta-lactamase-inhibitor protein II [Apiosordaria backusii]
MPPKRAAATGATSATKKTAATTATKKTTAAATKKTTTVTSTKKTTTAAATKKTAAATKKAAAPKAAAAAPKKTAPKRAAPKKTVAEAPESDKENEEEPEKKVTVSKRKRTQDDEEQPPVASSEDEIAKDDEHVDAQAQPAKKRKIAAPKAPVAKRPARALKVINEKPEQVLDMFVFGEGTAGELGLGSVKVDGKKPIDVKRPRLNPNVPNVVQIACGGMHVAALTKDNKIYTWGVNDQGALGRDTTWDGGLRDVEDEDDSDDEDDTGMNPKESTPAEIDATGLPEDIEWVQVVASDSATFALTTTGQVYGWGTFRSNEGVLGFSRTVSIQKTPAHVPELSKIKQLAAGLNHILALDEKNKIYAWGAGQQAQLARRLLERDDTAALYPTGVGALPGRAKAVKLACGSYHCFVIDTKGRVISWGLNNYAECGHEDSVGVDGGYVMRPQIVDSLSGYEIADIAGGEHHSLACTTDGKLLTWGRIDGHQVGQPAGSFSEDNTIYDDRQKPRILVVPTEIPEVKDVVQVAAGTDHSFAVTKEGKVYSWGFSANYQTGQGTTDDIESPTLIDNTAIRDRKIVFAGAGGQYGIVAAETEEAQN